MTLKRALEVSPELKRMYDSDPQVTELIDTALKVEGMPRHASTHAAGVVITDEPGVYIPGFGGLRIEDTVLVTPDGCEPLTKADKNLVEIH